MSARIEPRLTGAAAWIAGRWIETDQDLALRAADSTERAPIDVNGLFRGDRIPRADRVTQLGALVLARALHESQSIAPESVSVITASVLATAWTNERFERRRREGKAPEPRAFPYTAPNAAAGEFTIAAAAKGPTLALVGDGAVGLAAVERAWSWVQRGRCVRAIVIATECIPETPGAVAPEGISVVECAAAIVIEATSTSIGKPLRMSWRGPAPTESLGPLLSVEPLARLAIALRADASITLARACAHGGSMLEARVG